MAKTKRLMKTDDLPISEPPINDAPDQVWDIAGNNTPPEPVPAEDANAQVIDRCAQQAGNPPPEDQQAQLEDFLNAIRTLKADDTELVAINPSDWSKQ